MSNYKFHNFDKIFILIILFIFSFRIYITKFAILEQYPYYFPDSWHWLTDGLSYAGYNTNMDLRPPIVPLLIAFFFKIGMENLIPIMGQIFTFFAALGVYLLFSKIYNKEIGVYGAVLFLMNGYLLSYSMYILADIAALALIIFALYFFMLGVSENQFYFIPFGIISGLSFLTQYDGLFIIILVFGYLVINKNLSLIKQKNFILGIALYILVGSTWFIYRFLKFGDPFYSNTIHLGLINFHVKAADILYYSWGSLGFISIVCIILAIFGLLTRDSIFKKLRTFTLFWIILFFSFFTFIYSWNDNRFIIYWIVPVLFLSSLGLLRIRKISKILFIVIFIITLLSINMTRVPHYIASDIPILPGYYLTTSSPYMVQTDLQTNNFAYILYYNNRNNFPHESAFRVSFNVDPFVLPNIGTYIRENSDTGDLVGIIPLRRDGGFGYILRNQISALTRRQSVFLLDFDNIANKNIDFIIIESEKEWVEKLTEKGYKVVFIKDKYTVIKKVNEMI